MTQVASISQLFSFQRVKCVRCMYWCNYGAVVKFNLALYTTYGHYL